VIDRFEEERKTLGSEKAKLVKENQVKKARLEELEKQLTEFVDVSYPSALSSLFDISTDFFVASVHSAQRGFNRR